MIGLLDLRSRHKARGLTMAFVATFATLVLLSVQVFLLSTLPVVAQSTLDVCLGCTYESIQDAIDGSDPGDRIRVAQGIYTENLVITKGIILEGGYEASGWTRDIELYEATIDGNRSGSVISVTNASTVTIDGFTISGGQADNGGGIYVVDSTVVITGNKVLSNTAQDFGGGMYVENSAVMVTANDVISNSSGMVPDYSWDHGYGGGIAILDGSDFTVTGNYVAENAVFRGGGGIYITGSVGSLVGNEIAGNGTVGDSALGYGGGIYVKNCSPLIEGNDIVSNTLGTQEFPACYCAFGGGIFLVGSSSVITDNDISANGVTIDHSAWEDAQGGGIYVAQEHEDSCASFHSQVRDADISPVIANNRIVSNSVGAFSDRYAGSGGGISAWRTSVTIEGNEVIDNTSEDEAGGIAVLSYPIHGDNITALISANVVMSNTAPIEGAGAGGLMVAFVTSTIKDNLIAGNEGGLVGGLAVGGPRSLIEGNDIVGNTSGTVGGLLAETLGEITIVDNRIVGNLGYWSVGGIGVSDGPFVLSRNEIISNTGVFGGGIAAGSPATVTLDANEILGNHATETGGGIHFWPDTRFTLTNNIIADNSALELGGGIYISDSQGTLVNNTIAENEEGAGEGIYLAGSSAPTITNNIIVTHAYGIYKEGSGTPTVTYNDVWSNTVSDYWGVSPGPGNISTDPQLVDPVGWDYHLRPGSPGINAGHPDDFIAPPFDFDGDVRPQRGRVDIGADEVPFEFSIAKSGEPGAVSPGKPLSYTISITNLTEGTITDVVITDRVPLNASFAWAGDGGQLIGDEVVWTDVIVSAGETAEVTWGVTVTESLYVEEIINESYGVRRAEELEAVMGESVHTPLLRYERWLPLVMKNEFERPK